MRLAQDLPAHLQIARSPHLSDAISTVLHHGRDLLAHGATQVLRRDSPSTTSDTSKSSATCSTSPNGNTCEKPANTSAALPIALGIVIPLLSATVVLIYLHRRNKKRQNVEDRRDAEKYKSMDFGMDLTFANERKGKKGPPNTRANYRPDMHTRGMSLEAGSHPYMFPTNEDYSGSLRSLTQTIDDMHNPYRQADAMSIRAPSPSIRGGRDNDSLMTGTSIPRPGSANPDSAQSLLRYPQPPAKSYPARAPGDTAAHQASPIPGEIKAFESGFAPVVPVTTLALPASTASRDSYNDQAARGLRASNNYLGNFIHSRDPSAEVDSKSATSPSTAESVTSTLVNSPSATSPSMPDPLKPAKLDFGLPQVVTTFSDDMPETHVLPTSPAAASPLEPQLAELPASRTHSVSSFVPRVQSVASVSKDRTSQHGQTHPARGQSMEAPIREYHNSYMSESSNYDDYQYRDSTVSLNNAAPPRGQSSAAPMQTLDEDYAQEYYEYARASQYLDVDDNAGNQRFSVMSRPLPPDDPNETPEIRANRIRSFYKEYFDKRDTTYQQPGAPGDYQLPAGSYYEDYDQEYMDSAAIYDPDSGQFIMPGAPYAQPMTRRAMTPPPRGPPRFRGGPPPSNSRPGSRAHSRGVPSYGPSRPRVHSSASNYGMPPRPGSSMSSMRGRAPNRRPMPPPTNLTSLPTPHRLKDDAIFGATIDFAPPVSIRDLQNGRRPDSPMGTSRPYSPSVRSFNPLASSFDDLSSMPSPHLLRKSGTFTGLDFAPPKRFKDGNSDAHSDVGSVRSGRSGISGVHAWNVRNGAYRVSKIPRELAGTKDEITASLKPKWDISR